jgi:hypothetical protein
MHSACRDMPKFVLKAPDPSAIRAKTFRRLPFGLWNGILDVAVRSGDDMDRNQFANPFCGGTTGIRGGFDRTDISAHKYGYKAPADEFPTDEFNFCRLHHCIGSLNGADQTSGFNHT